MRSNSISARETQITTTSTVPIVIDCVCTSALFEMIGGKPRSEEHTSELQSRQYLVCRPPIPTLFPYTTLFRSDTHKARSLLIVTDRSHCRPDLRLHHDNAEQQHKREGDADHDDFHGPDRDRLRMYERFIRNDRGEAKIGRAHV